MKQLVTYGFLLMSLFTFASADPFDEGNELYEKGDYGAAIEVYTRIISEGQYSVALYYNLGNAYYRNEELGKAIWAYESALKIDPDHENALHNLSFANAQTVEKLDTERHGFGHWLQGLAFSSHVNLWAIISIICSLMLTILATIFIRTRSKSRKNFSFIGAGLLLIALIFSIWLGHKHKELIMGRSEGVIITKQVDILIAPTEDAKTTYVLSEGAKVEVVSDKNDWVQIDLNGNKGWIQKKDIWEI